jgi:glutaredoxin-like protein NrdH
MVMDLQHVEGENRGKILLFALSTCGWCRKTRMLLEELGVGYDYIYVDLLEGDERAEAIDELKHWNPQLSFPTIVINDQRPIIGFDKMNIKETVG